MGAYDYENAYVAKFNSHDLIDAAVRAVCRMECCFKPVWSTEIQVAHYIFAGGGGGSCSTRARNWSLDPGDVSIC